MIGKPYHIRVITNIGDWRNFESEKAVSPPRGKIAELISDFSVLLWPHPLLMISHCVSEYLSWRLGGLSPN